MASCSSACGSRCSSSSGHPTTTSSSREGAGRRRCGARRAKQATDPPTPAPQAAESQALAPDTQVHLKDTQYPSTRRVRMGLCHGGMLPYYPVVGRAETATMRHATPTLYEAAVAVWRAFWHDLPPCAQDTPPDLICIQPFDAARGDKMDYHSDGVSRFEDQPIAMRRGAPVITLNLFADFNFWWRRCHNFKKARVQRAIRLGDGMCMLWPWEDDTACRHGVWFPRGVREGLRVSVVFRWSSMLAPFASVSPYRILVGSEAERACMEVA